IAPASATKLAFLTQPGTAGASQNFAGGSGVRVAIEDAFGNLVTSGTSSVTLALYVAGSNDTVPAEGVFTAVANPAPASHGVATFNFLSQSLAGTYNLQAFSPGLGSVDSDSFIITPAPALVGDYLFYKGSSFDT